MRYFILLTAALLLATPAAADEGSMVYRLYRTSSVTGVSPMMIATFDAPHANALSTASTEAGRILDYNKENCDVAAKLFISQPGVTVQYFCLLESKDK